MRVVKRKGSAYATAAVLVIGIFAGLVVFNKSASISLADVQAAVAGQTWVHVKFDNGREEWTNLRDGRSFLREVGGDAVFLDPIAGVRLDYRPISGQHIQRDRSGRWPTPCTPWELVVGTPQQRAQAGGAEPDLTEDVVDGRRLVRADIFTVDALGKWIVIRQIWADPKTRLPVLVKNKLNLRDRREQNREYITGRYEFPSAGPSSMEDLGVPANLPIIDSDAPSPQDAQQIIAAVQAAQARFPTHYRIIRYGAKDSGNILIFWRSGDRFRLDNYWNIDPGALDFKALGYDKYHLDLPATADKILAWARTQEGVHDIYIYADGKSYSRRNPHPAVSGLPTQPEARVQQISGPVGMMLTSGPNWPHNQPWPYANTRGAWQILPVSEDIPAGCVGLRYEAGDIRRDCIIDPAHDYICVNKIMWKQKDGQWIKDRQDQLLDLQQLPTGQWYPRQWKFVGWTLENPPRPYETVQVDDVQMLDDADFSPDLFNGEKLLEGAKVETY